MYSWLWRKLPGNLAIKLFQVALLAAGAFALMYFYVFPWFDGILFPELVTEI